MYKGRWCGRIATVISGTVATWFKRVSNTEVRMHNYRMACKHLYHTYIFIHLSQIIVKLCIIYNFYIFILHCISGGYMCLGHAVC